MGRNYSIDFIKLILAMFIAIGHARIELISSDIIVHCFFILSGFFMVKSFDSGKYRGNSYEYTKARFFRIFPYYIAALIMYLLILFIQNRGGDLYYFVSKLKNIIPEIFLLQNTGFFITGGINYPLWQMSVLFIASFILFGLLSFNRNLTLTVICPLLTLTGFAYWENLYNSHEIQRWGMEFGFIYVPLIRGAAAISLGMFSYEIITNIVTWIKKRNLNPMYMYILLTLSIFYYYLNNNNSLAFWGFAGIVIVCLSPNGLINFIFNRKYFSICEKLSLSVYFNHAILLQIVGRDVLTRATHKNLAIFVYCIIILFASFFVLKIVDYIVRKLALI